MNVYKDMLDVIIKREFALLGRNQTKDILKNVGVNIDDNWKVENADGISLEKIEEILSEIKEKIGFVGLLVVKLPIRRIAIQNNVEVPKPLL